MSLVKFILDSLFFFDGIINGIVLIFLPDDLLVYRNKID